MNVLKYAESFRDLLVNQKARGLQKEIFLISQTFPKEEKYSLSDQIRRSSRSIGANIAEAWAKRRYEAHFTSKLTDADGEQYETQHWLETAVECGYLDAGRGGGRSERAGRFRGWPGLDRRKAGLGENPFAAEAGVPGVRGGKVTIRCEAKTVDARLVRTGTWEFATEAGEEYLVSG